jgi:hypothetical protein
LCARSFLFFVVGRRARAGENQGADFFREEVRKLKSYVTAHRQSADRRAVDLRIAHQCRDIACHLLHRRDFAGELVLTHAPQVWSQAPVATRREKLDLFAPHGIVERISVKEKNCRK